MCPAGETPPPSGHSEVPPEDDLALERPPPRLQGTTPRRPRGPKKSLESPTHPAADTGRSDAPEARDASLVSVTHGMGVLYVPTTLAPGGAPIPGGPPPMKVDATMPATKPDLSSGAVQRGTTNLLAQANANAAAKGDTPDPARSALFTRLFAIPRILGGYAMLEAGVLSSEFGIGVLLAAHGADQLQTGAREFVTGKPQTSILANAVGGTASGLGASPSTAATIGGGADLAVGLALGGGLGPRGEGPLLFGQKRVSPTFRMYSDASDQIRGRSVIDVAASLKSGELSANELPIEFFVHEGQRITVNNRGLAALRLAGMEPTLLRQVPSTAKLLARLREAPIDAAHAFPGLRMPVTLDRHGGGHLYTVIK